MKDIHEMQRYIDGIDQKLFDLNNQISEIEYKNDYQNQSLSCDELKSEILGIFQSGKLKEIIKNYSAEGKDPILNKKMQVLKNEMHLAAVENDSDYLLCNNDIEKLFRDFNYMEHYGILLHSEKHNDRETALNEIEKQCCCTQKASICLIRTLNQLSRQRGYASYPSLKLASEGLTIKELKQFFQSIRNQYLPFWNQALCDYTKKNHTQPKNEDLYSMTKLFCGFSNQEFELEKPLPFLEKFLSSMGIFLHDLPISLQTASLSFSGSCYRVCPNRDVRVLINQDQSAMAQLTYGLHEMGHALYYCHCPENSELLLDHHLSREIMADILAQFLNQPDFYELYFNESKQKIQDYVRASSLKNKLNLMILIRDSMFIVESFLHEEESFPEVWKSVTKYWLGLDVNDSAYELFDFLNPLDLKSYVFSQILSERVFQRLFSRNGFSKKFYDTLIQEYHKPGALVDWKTKSYFIDERIVQ